MASVRDGQPWMPFRKILEPSRKPIQLAIRPGRVLLVTLEVKNVFNSALWVDMLDALQRNFRDADYFLGNYVWRRSRRWANGWLAMQLLRPRSSCSPYRRIPTVMPMTVGGIEVQIKAHRMSGGNISRCPVQGLLCVSAGWWGPYAAQELVKSFTLDFFCFSGYGHDWGNPQRPACH